MGVPGGAGWVERERELHNFASHLLRVVDGRVTEWWMVDAKPAESDEFWS